MSTAKTITPVLLCGGSGSRLWPLSRKSHPKQFAPFLGDESLFQAAAQRFSGAGFDAPLVVTSDQFRFIVTEQLAACHLAPQDILIEPDGRNTAPATIAAALHLAVRDPQGLMLLSPSDHAVADPELFRDMVQKGATAAADGQIVTFGITPTKPETGYGWLTAGKTTYPDVQDLTQFIEKPDLAAARILLENPNNLWNAGVFLVRVDVLIAAFQTYAPDIYSTVLDSLKAARLDLGFTRLNPALWQAVPAQSIDYAIMEKTDNLSVVRFDGLWSDLGSWESVWQQSDRDSLGNACTDHATALNCTNTLLRSENPGIELVGIGLDNVVAIAMADAVLVADMSQTQEVKMIVETLKQNQARQAEHLPVLHRPWGWVETLIFTDHFQVRRISLHPNASLSLQSHAHRSEHWVVVEGQARVTIGSQTRMLEKNQSVFVPTNTKHQLKNPGKDPLVVIEVQTGSSLIADDIIRYTDTK